MKKTYKISKLFKFDKENKAGLYITLIFHLVILIVLFGYSIHVQIAKEVPFVLDFSKQEELEKAQKEQELIESVNQELDALIKAAQKETPRNVIVNVNTKNLKDDRYSHPEQIYEEARKLQEKLDKNRRDIEDADNDEDNVSLEDKKKEKEESTYKGPSVISYSLDGRKARRLPIPAYKCIAGGDVSVSIIVNRKGRVLGAQIIESVSSPDICLREYALKAAKLSRFTASQNAPEREVGEIVYRFVEQ